MRMRNRVVAARILLLRCGACASGIPRTGRSEDLCDPDRSSNIHFIRGHAEASTTKVRLGGGVFASTTVHTLCSIIILHLHHRTGVGTRQSKGHFSTRARAGGAVHRARLTSAALRSLPARGRHCYFTVRSRIVYSAGLHHISIIIDAGIHDIMPVCYYRHYRLIFYIPAITYIHNSCTASAATSFTGNIPSSSPALVLFKNIVRQCRNLVMFIRWMIFLYEGT